MYFARRSSFVILFPAGLVGFGMVCVVIQKRKQGVCKRGQIKRNVRATYYKEEKINVCGPISFLFVGCLFCLRGFLGGEENKK